MILITGETVKNYLSEFIGTFGFVFIGCGAVVFAAPFIGYLGISMAFGLAYSAMGMAFAGHHFNPAVTVAAAISNRFHGKNIWFTLIKTIAYIVMQLLGACAAVALIYYVYSGKNGYVYQGAPDLNVIQRYTLSSAFCLESVLSLLFLCVFLGSNEHQGRQSVACGLFITTAFLLSYPVTKGSLNPARTTASAIISADETAIAQLSLFWGAGLLAALIAGICYHPIFRGKKDPSAS